MINYIPLYILSAVLSFGLCIIINKVIIPPLKRKAAQPIYMGGPAWHGTKSGTPTLGGISFICAVLVSVGSSSLLLFAIVEKDTAISVILIVSFALLNSLIGLIDDLTKLTHKRNKGLSPLQKLFLQLLCAILFLTVRSLIFGYNTEIAVSGFTLDLGIFYYPASVFFLLGIINCANLTDGIDGLATSVSGVMCICLFIISAFSFPDVGLVSCTVAASALGFLFFNVNPAKIFMGDTGSLFLGAIAASVVFSIGNPFLSAIFGGVYVIEGLSVIVQVISYKTRKKRVFLMSPLHHHFEKLGWNESKICLCAAVLTAGLSAVAYLLI